MHAVLFFKDFIYLLMRDRDRDRERGRDTGGGRSRLHAGSPMWESIPVSRIMPWAEGNAKLLRHSGCPGLEFLSEQVALHSLFTMWVQTMTKSQGINGRTTKRKESGSLNCQMKKSSLPTQASTLTCYISHNKCTLDKNLYG